jgi:hypothetical protein
MTMTAFLPFERKPQKTIAAMLCKYSNMVAKPTTGAEWMFQGPVKGGRGSMIVQVVDFRDFMVSSEREWADDVGWEWNWAIAVSVTHKRRSNEEYAFWHAFTIVLMNAYNSAEVWLSSDEDGFPTTPFSVDELLPELMSSEAEDVMPSEEAEEEVDLPPPPPRLRSEPEPEPEVEEVEEEIEGDEEVEEEIEEDEEIEDAPPRLRLIPVDYDEDEEEEPEDEGDSEGEASDAIIDW